MQWAAADRVKVLGYVVTTRNILSSYCQGIMLFRLYFLNFKPYFLQNFAVYSFFFLFITFLICVSPLLQLCSIACIYIFTHVSVLLILFLIFPFTFYSLFLIPIRATQFCILISVIFIFPYFTVTFYIKVAQI